MMWSSGNRPTTHRIWSAWKMPEGAEQRTRLLIFVHRFWQSLGHQNCAAETNLPSTLTGAQDTCLRSWVRRRILAIVAGIPASAVDLCEGAEKERLGGGRYWTRTSDPCDVNTVLYQ